MINKNKYYTFPEIAEILGVAKKTVYGRFYANQTGLGVVIKDGDYAVIGKDLELWKPKKTGTKTKEEKLEQAKKLGIKVIE